MIRLERITKDNYQECISLKVAVEQAEYVADNVLSLAKAYVYNDIVTPFAIYDEDLMVGFIMLRFNVEYSSYFIWQFMIDRRFQSRGYGRKALKLAVEWITKDTRCSSIVTTFIKGNEQAERLYLSLGFRRMSESDNEVDMVLNL